MHDGQVATDANLVSRLVASQFPQWQRLPVTSVESFGTDHDAYRLGDRLSVRLPVIDWATAQADKEAEWLPRLAPRLPLRVPLPVGAGHPELGYPFTWSVTEWLSGEDAVNAELDLTRGAEDLAGFVLALRLAPTEGAPERPRGARGSPLAELDTHMRDALDNLGDRVDRGAVERIWDSALEAEPHQGPNVWVHGDLLPGNLIVSDGRLTGVIDFGGLNVGDPACDLQPAWSLFQSASRDAYREALGADDAAWLRGRGWSAVQAVMALPYYWGTNPGIVRQSWRVLGALGLAR